MSSTAAKKQRKWAEYLAFTRQTMCEHFEKNDIDYFFSPVFKKYDDLHNELAEMVDSIEYFGGITMLKYYAAKGMEAENPEHFNKAVVKNGKQAEMPLK